MPTARWSQTWRRNYMYFPVVVFICLLYSVNVLSAVTPGGTNPARRNAPCTFKKIACRLRKESYCPAGEECIDVRIIPNTVANSTVKCEYVCKPKVLTGAALPANSTVQNQTQDGNLTTTERVTPWSWRDDPAYCTANFYCVRGICKTEYKINDTVHVCECPPNTAGNFCQKNCSKECMNNGTCDLVPANGADQEVCKCNKGFRGKECEEVIVPEERAALDEDPELLWYIPVFGCLCALLLILTSYFVLQKLKWRSLFVTKLFHFFQPYEDDDGKMFDAFISFKSSKKDYSQSDDEKFVLQVLQPMLEKELNFKVCVHYRDFMPGETIANNIIWAVENSRRTILVLSPLYVESDWARMEYQKAQQEMLQLRHKIIPIIFEDIANTTIVDPTLKHILGSVTYIHYPKSNDEKEHSKFWQMVGLALPKKRLVQEESSSTHSHPVFTLTTSQTFVSQESWQSARTDITDIEMEGVTEADDVGDSVTNPATDHMTVDVNMDLNEADKIRSIKVIADPVNLNNNAEKYITMLDGVS